MGKSWSSTKGKAKSWLLEGITSGTSAQWRAVERKAALWKRTLGSWWTRSWPWATNAPSQQKKKVNSILAVLGRVLPAGQKRWSFPSQCWWDHIWSPKTILAIRPLHRKHHTTETQNSWCSKRPLENIYSNPMAQSRVSFLRVLVVCINSVHISI